MRGSNSWLNSMLGIYNEPGVVLEKGEHSSYVYLFITGKTIVLLNDYIERVDISLDEDYNIGDLVELKESIRAVIFIEGFGIILEKTRIDTTDMLDSDIDPFIDAYLIYFPSCETEYTIPTTCVQLFSPDK